MNNHLPTRVILSLVFGLFLSLAAPVKAFAASAYISPATGLITNKNFKVSVYVESSTTEPEIAGANLTITYPASVTVVSVDQADFDSYLQATYDAATRKVTINAVNNAGNYKSGKVKLAAINFEAVDSTGQVQLAIDSNSEISGAGGEQLLTETINGVYSLDLPPATTPPETETEIGGGTETTTTTTETAAVPETGGFSDYMVYILIAGSLVVSGIALNKPLLNKGSS